MKLSLADDDGCRNTKHSKIPKSTPQTAVTALARFYFLVLELLIVILT